MNPQAKSATMPDEEMKSPTSKGSKPAHDLSPRFSTPKGRGTKRQKDDYDDDDIEEP